MRKAGDVLESLFSSRFGQQFAEKARLTAGLFSAWVDMTTEVWAAGDADIPPAASHSRIREFEKGALLVEADHPGWVQILQTKQQELLSTARRRFPEMDIRSISFCLSREPFSFSAAIPSDEEQVLSEAPVPDKDTEGDSEIYYEALKRLEVSVKERYKQS